MIRVYHSLFNHSPVEGYWVIYSLGKLRIKLLETFMYRFLCERKFVSLGLNAQECSCWVVR